MKDVMANLKQTSSEKILLSWVRQSTKSYPQVNVVNFSSSWEDGLAFNALIHSHRLVLQSYSIYLGSFKQLGNTVVNAKELWDFVFIFARPELFDWDVVEQMDKAFDRLDHAFAISERHLGIERLLDPEGICSYALYLHLLLLCL